MVTQSDDDNPQVPIYPRISRYIDQYRQVNPLDKTDKEIIAYIETYKERANDLARMRRDLTDLIYLWADHKGYNYVSQLDKDDSLAFYCGPKAPGSNQAMNKKAYEEGDSLTGWTLIVNTRGRATALIRNAIKRMGKKAR